MKKVQINPIVLKGSWDVGYALDIHTLSSEYIGDDAFGKPRFKTIYTPLGEAIHELKYHGDYSTLSQIIDSIMLFLEEHKEYEQIETILPVPPTEKRIQQPVFVIAEKLAEEMNIFCCVDVLKSISIYYYWMIYMQQERH